jgi:intein-encoded DNA endonuclease-like protein
MFVAGISMRKIAEHFGTNHSTISKVLKSQGYTSDFRKKLNEEDILEKYADGKSAASIAKSLKVSNQVVLRILRLNGIKTDKNLDLDVDEIKKLYSDENLSTVKIAEMMEVHPTTINQRLKKAGVEIRSREDCAKKYKLNESYFDQIDSEEKAYWLGFLFADGYVKSNMRDVGLALKIDDSNHLEKLKLQLEYDGPVRSYEGNTTFGPYKYARLELASRSLAASLIAHGCTPRKTHNLEEPIGLPDELFRHFCRGVVDGDGYIGVYSNYSTVEIVGDKKLLDWMKLVSPVNIDEPRPHKSIWRIRTKANQSIEYIEWMYSNARVSLDRKADLAKKAMERFKK